MIIKYDADRAFRRIMRVEVGQQADEFDTAMAVFHACRNMAVLYIQPRQDGTRAQPFVLVIAADLRMFARDRLKVGCRVGDGLHTAFHPPKQ